MGTRSMSCGNCRVKGMATLRVELFWDEEASNWHYRVPALYINGGGTATREQAERESLSALAFHIAHRHGVTLCDGRLGKNARRAADISSPL
jgi:hypothetical protein